MILWHRYYFICSETSILMIFVYFTFILLQIGQHWSKTVNPIIIQVKVCFKTDHTADVILSLSHPEHKWAIRLIGIFFQIGRCLYFKPLSADSDDVSDNIVHPYNKRLERERSLLMWMHWTLPVILTTSAPPVSAVWTRAVQKHAKHQRSETVL